MNWASVFSGLFGALAGYTLAVALRLLWRWWREPKVADFPPSMGNAINKRTWNHLKGEFAGMVEQNNRSMADECEAMRKEFDEEIAKQPLHIWDPKIIANGGDGNVIRVSAYTRRKQTRRPEGGEVKHGYWLIRNPGGDERYVYVHPARDEAEVRQDYPKALKCEPLERGAWMEASGRRSGAGAA